MSRTGRALTGDQSTTLNAECTTRESLLCEFRWLCVPVVRPTSIDADRFYISGHGFGHASRDIELMLALLDTPAGDDAASSRTGRARAPLLAAGGVRRGPAIDGTSRPTAGIAQIDSLQHRRGRHRPAGGALLRGLRSARGRRSARASTAASAGLVVGDIPPLAFAAAARAGVPSVGGRQLHLGLDLQHLSRVRPARAPRAAGDPPRVCSRRRSRCGCRCTAGSNRWRQSRATSRSSRADRRAIRADTRRALGLRERSARSSCRRSARYGADLPLERAGTSSDRFAPIDAACASRRRAALPGSGRRRGRRRQQAGLRDRVRSASRTATALLYTSRGRFVEYDVFVEEMPRVLRCRYISQEDLLAGRWADAD